MAKKTKANKISVLDLKPTQFVLGMKEIESKVCKLLKMDEQEIEKYCNDHVIPVVLGPNKTHFMIDHHHFARACWETKIENFQIEILKDLSSLSEKEFWNFMIKNDWTYLYDQFGMGPHIPQSLPMDIRCMADDPFRSLAWAVREGGGIKKVETPFFEFRWASFFRLNLILPLHSKSDFKDAIKIAMSLAKSKEAKHLPGYTMNP